MKHFTGVTFLVIALSALSVCKHSPVRAHVDVAGRLVVGQNLSLRVTLSVSGAHPIFISTQPPISSVDKDRPALAYDRSASANVLLMGRAGETEVDAGEFIRLAKTDYNYPQTQKVEPDNAVVLFIQVPAEQTRELLPQKTYWVLLRFAAYRKEPIRLPSAPKNAAGMTLRVLPLASKAFLDAPTGLLPPADFFAETNRLQIQAEAPED